MPDAGRKRGVSDDPGSGWDQERRASDLAPPAVHLTGTTAYVNASLKTALDKANGGPTVAVRTKTFPESAKVWIGAATKQTPGARSLRVSETEATASFGFSVSLRKLNLRLPASAKLICPAKPVKGQKATFEIVLAEGRYEERSVDEVKIVAAREARLAKARAKRAERRQPLRGPAAEEPGQ